MIHRHFDLFNFGRKALDGRVCIEGSVSRPAVYLIERSGKRATPRRVLVGSIVLLNLLQLMQRRFSN